MIRSGYLIWFAVLGSMVVRPTSSSCEVATSAVSASCAAAGAIAGGVGGITCAATLGIGCAVAIAGAATAATCQSVSDNIDCSAGEPSSAEIMAKLNEIIGFLEDIEETVDKIYDEVELGFFEQKYNEYINKIRNADARHKIDVLEKSVDPAKPGLIMDTQWARDWATDVLGDGDYNCRGALDMMDEMVVGVISITGRMTPSVYALAYEKDLCSLQLYDLISSLITQGSTLVFNAMEIRGDSIHDVDVKQLEDRLRINNETFYAECSKPTPRGAETWSEWSNSNQRGSPIRQICPTNSAVTAMTWREQNGYGLIDLAMSCGDYTTKFTENGRGGDNTELECSETGKYNGFGAIQSREQNGYGLINTEMLCYDAGDSSWLVSNNNYRGGYNRELHCPEGAVITGMEVRNQHGYGLINLRTRCTVLAPKRIPATPPPSERQSTWTSWSNGNGRGSVIQRLCPRNHAVESMQWKRQYRYGLVELFIDCGFGQEIAFTRNGNGDRMTKKTCSSLTNYGFSVVQGREKSGYGIVDSNMKCTNDAHWTSSTGTGHGSWNRAYSCPTGYVITGMEVREQNGYGIINFRAHCTEWNM